MIKCSTNKEKKLEYQKTRVGKTPPPNLSLYFFIHSTIDIHEEKINRPIKELYANTNKQSMEMRKTDQDLAVEIEPRTRPNWGKITKSNFFRTQPQISEAIFNNRKQERENRILDIGEMNTLIKQSVKSEKLLAQKIQGI